jgi:hypothetical protein
MGPIPRTMLEEDMFRYDCDAKLRQKVNISFIAGLFKLLNEKKYKKIEESPKETPVFSKEPIKVIEGLKPLKEKSVDEDKDYF